MVSCDLILCESVLSCQLYWLFFMCYMLSLFIYVFRQKTPLLRYSDLLHPTFQ